MFLWRTLTNTFMEHVRILCLENNFPCYHRMDLGKEIVYLLCTRWVYWESYSTHINLNHLSYNTSP